MRGRAGLALVLTLLLSAAAAAQHPDMDVGPVAPGEGSLRGRVEAAAGAAGAADLDVVLYALPADGAPGVARTRTDAAGRFAFEGISNDPSTVYLVGVRSDGIPYGQRVVFEPERREAFVTIAVAAPDPDPSQVERGSSFVRIDRACSALRVNEAHELRNPGTRVVFVPPEARGESPPVFEAELPEQATDFVTPMGVVPEGLEQDGRRLRFWGPVHPGRQELEFGYLLPSSATGAAAPAAAASGSDVERALAGGEVTVAWHFPAGAPRVVLLAQPGGPEPRGEALRRDRLEDRSIDGRDYRAAVAEALAPGARLEVAIEVPPAPAVPIALRRSTLWIEIDGAAVVVEEQHVLEVAGGQPLAAQSDAPLVCLPLPAGAEALRFSQATLDMGLDADPGGALAVRGPLPPGESALALRYRVPAPGGAARFQRSFPFELPLLSVFVADTGIRADTDRLHRLRTVRTNDRSYLHLEGFGIAQGETVELRLAPLPAPRPLSGIARAAFAFAVAVGGIAFLAAPLRGRAEAAAAGESAAERLAGEREAVYAAIRDLDEDFETGKLTPADHASMRDELRSRALALAQSEREAQEGRARPEARDAAPAPGRPAPAGAVSQRCPDCETALPRAARFCPQCGTRLEAAAG
jgi:hypothetical protein